MDTERKRVGWVLVTPSQLSQLSEATEELLGGGFQTAGIGPVDKNWPGDWGDRANPRGSKTGDLRATRYFPSSVLPVTAISIHRIIFSRLVNLN
jgi:hypothetical protein